MGRVLRKVGLWALGLGLVTGLTAGGLAAIWFPIEAIVNFQPQNVTIGWPGNPRMPANEQRTDLVLDSLIMIAIGVVLVAGAVLIIIAVIKDLRDSRQR